MGKIHQIEINKWAIKTGEKRRNITEKRKKYWRKNYPKKRKTYGQTDDVKENCWKKSRKIYKEEKHKKKYLGLIIETNDEVKEKWKHLQREEKI